MFGMWVLNSELIKTPLFLKSGVRRIVLIIMDFRKPLLEYTHKTYDHQEP